MAKNNGIPYERLNAPQSTQTQGQGLPGRVLKGEPYSEDKLSALEKAILDWREQMAVKYSDLDMSADVPSAYSMRVPDLIATIRALQADLRARDEEIAELEGVTTMQDEAVQSLFVVLVDRLGITEEDIEAWTGIARTGATPDQDSTEERG